MTWHGKSKLRSAAIRNGYRSGFESKLVELLQSKNIKFKYEETAIKWIQPETSHKYTPDFFLPNNVIIEAKGRWTADDRKKHVLIKQQHPDLDIRFIFQNPNSKLRKGTKTTYADFCDKHGFKWCSIKSIPEEWLSI
jgi:hypothetical protein